MTDIIQPEDHVIIYQDKKLNWLIKLHPGKQFHTSDGHVDHDEIIGKSFGTIVRTHLGTSFFLLRPTTLDYILTAPRKTNIIYPKDAGLILLYAGIQSGSRIVESGAGSGALTTLLTSIVKPDGHVFTYEIRNDFFELTKRNLLRVGLSEYSTLHHQDVTNGISEKDIDVIILDLGAPWSVIPEAWKALRPSGIFTSYSPTIDQVMKTTEALHHEKWCDAKTVECFVRDIMVRPGKTRPATRMIGHTGYLTFARKIIS